MVASHYRGVMKEKNILHWSRGARNQEWLYWWQPAATQQPDRLPIIGDKETNKEAMILYIFVGLHLGDAPCRGDNGPIQHANNLKHFRFTLTLSSGKYVCSLKLDLHDVHHMTCVSSSFCRLLWQLKGEGCSRNEKDGNIFEILKREALFKLILKAELYEMKCLGLLLGEIVVCRNVLTELQIFISNVLFWGKLLWGPKRLLRSIYHVILKNGRGEHISNVSNN